MKERVKQITGQVLDEIVPETWVALGYDKIKEIQNRTAELLIIDLMQRIKDPAIYNRCVRTTFDLSIADCVKVEIFKMIEEIYGIKDTK
jgi:hypothetical protein